MRNIITIILLLFMSVTTQAKEKQYNVKEFQKAYTRFLQLSEQADADAIKHYADSVRKAGAASGNYRTEMLYYSAMNTVMLIDGTADSIRISIFDEAMKRARALGSDMLYWRYYSSKVVDYIYINPVTALDMAEQMLKEATANRSQIGLIHSYYAQGYIYAMRSETLMAINVLEKAVNIGKSNLNDEEIVKDLYDYIYDLLAQCYAALPAYDKALEVYDLIKQHTISGISNNALNLQDKLLSIDAAKAVILFDDERYTDFDALLSAMRRNPNFQTIISSDEYSQLQLCTLLRDGKDGEAWQMIQQAENNDDRHNLLYVYYKYRKDYAKAMKEWEAMQLARDSALYETRLSDIESMDTKIGNADLRLQQERMQNHQRRLIWMASAAILLLIILFLIVLYIRNRRHTKVLTEKNTQLDIARQDAEQARDDAEQARDEAILANKVKTHFIENMTHEIHTPLNAINGFVQILAEPSMQGMFGEDELMEMYKSIGDSATDLTNLVDNIITITEAEAKHERTVMRPVSIHSLVQAVMAEGKQPDAAIQFHSDLSALPDDFSLVTNERLLKQILDKIINNAVKFTTQGEILVSATIDNDYVVDISHLTFAATNTQHPSPNTQHPTPNTQILTDQKGVLLLTVHDTGPGIPQGKEEIIFERFKKLDEYIPGTGLGLSVCRALAPRIYGDVYCDMTKTAEGKGSVFTIRIPLHTAPYELQESHFSYNEMLGCY